MKTMVLLCIYLCGLYANNLDIVDSKGRTFWDKKFIRYPAEGTYLPDEITKTCDTKEYFDEVGLQTNSKNKTIVENFPMEQGEEVKMINSQSWCIDVTTYYKPLRNKAN